MDALSDRDIYMGNLRSFTGHRILQSSLKVVDDLHLFDEAMNGNFLINVKELAENAGLKESFVSALVQSLVVSQLLDFSDNGQTCIPPQYANDLKDTMTVSQISRELQDFAEVVHACARIGGQPGFTKAQKYQAWRAISMDEVLDTVKAIIIEREVNVKHILDFGCFHGELTMALAGHFEGMSVHGCDVSLANIAICNNKMADIENVAFSSIPNSCDLPPRWDRQFDVIVIFQAAFHDIPNSRTILEEAIRVLDDNGIIIFIESELGNKPLDYKFPESSLDLAIRFWYCLPSGHPDLAVERYEIEKTNNFLNDCGLAITGHTQMHCSIWSHAFVCVKNG